MGNSLAIGGYKYTIVKTSVKEVRVIRKIAVDFAFNVIRLYTRFMVIVTLTHENMSKIYNPFGGCTRLLTIPSFKFKKRPHTILPK